MPALSCKVFGCRCSFKRIVDPHSGEPQDWEPFWPPCPRGLTLELSGVVQSFVSSPL